MVVFASFFEWAFHRFVMHKPLRFFSCPSDAHAMVHHQIFRADHTYHFQKKEDEAEIPMAWWNGPALIVATCLHITAVAFFTTWRLLLGAFLEATAYYCTYEYLLWCMHKPTTHVVERLGIFFRFNAQAQGQSVPNVQPKIAPQGPERKLDAA